MSEQQERWRQERARYYAKDENQELVKTYSRGYNHGKRGLEEKEESKQYLKGYLAGFKNLHKGIA
jgi:hypothetical protein